jgi:hypothetical protein
LILSNLQQFNGISVPHGRTREKPNPKCKSTESLKTQRRVGVPEVAPPLTVASPPLPPPAAVFTKSC